MVVNLYLIIIEAFYVHTVHTYARTYFYSFLVCGGVFHLMGDACYFLDYIGGQEEEEGCDGAVFGTEWRKVSRLG